MVTGLKVQQEVTSVGTSCLSLETLQSDQSRSRCRTGVCLCVLLVLMLTHFLPSGSPRR